MSSNPDQQNPQPEGEAAPESIQDAAPPAASEPAVEAPAESAPEPAAEPAAELFAAAPLAKVEPEPEPEAKPEPAPKPAAAAPEPAPAPMPEVVTEEAPLFRSITSGPRKKSKAAARAKPAPTPLQPRELEPEAGDFDAVFEARSDAGLGDRLTPTACYLLMVFSPLTLGVAAIPAVVLAYMNRETAPAWMAGHYVYQIRTFWAAVLIALAAIGTIFFWERGIVALAFGVFFNLVLLLGVTWFVLRAATGLMRLRRGQAIKDPRAWGF